jgi:integrase
VTVRGRRSIFPLGTHKARAIELDRCLRARLRRGQPAEEIKVWLASELANRDLIADANGETPQGDVTLGDIVRLHQATYFEALPVTIFHYAISLLNLVEAALRYRHGLRPIHRVGQRVTLDHYPTILSLPVSILDDRLVADFMASRMAGITRGAPAERSRKISTNTELRQARCVFSQEAIMVYRRAGFQLPDLLPFLRAPRFRRVTCRPQLPGEATVIGVFAGLRQLAAASERELFTAVGLAIGAGLRRTEILHAHRSWLQTTAGPSVVVRLAEDFRTKNYTERTIPIAPWLFETLAARPPDSYLLAGDLRTRARSLDRAVRWLRQNGLEKVAKPLHTLRALYAAYLLATEHSPFRIKSRLGHADLTTTFRYYADEPLASELVAFWTQPGGSSGNESWMWGPYIREAIPTSA